MTFLNAASIVGGLAIVVNGLRRRAWWSDEPAEDAARERPRQKPWIYIAFGLGIFACGVYGLFQT
ncbi:MAG TPA: hypothetical protein VM554_09935 [Acidisarcina sp.]|nr:hypothetical protein [Acidisarcina sp.]